MSAFTGPKAKRGDTQQNTAWKRQKLMQLTA